MVDNNITLSTVLEKYFNSNKKYGNDSRYSARELQKILGYSRWSTFKQLVEKAKNIIDKMGVINEEPFAPGVRMVTLGSGSERQVEDIYISRKAVNIIIQNADSRKEKVIEARRYLEKTQLKVNENALIKTNKNIPNDLNYQIHIVRGKPVMIDSDLAILYQVETKVLNQAVKRNIDRFPSNFSFYLTPKEFENWKSQIVTSNREKYGLRKLPRAFTEQGIAMLSAVLKSDTAVKISIEIMQSFVNFRHLLVKNKNLLKKIILIEKQQMEHAIRQNTFEQEQNKLQDQQNQLEINTKSQFSKVFNAIDKYHIMPNQGIFFDGQIFDAHHFVSDLIRSAEKSIILIDNYVDDSVLHLLTKRNNGVSVLIYSQKISKSLQLDLKKYNAQYSPVKMIEYAGFHDRFLILDHMRLYHIGASLKDLGKKVFAFSLLEVGLNEILRKIMHAN